ncbi:MAG: adenylate/guanylate cyclase domain-containing protein, partial [Burkholderiales bacterium]
SLPVTHVTAEQQRLAETIATLEAQRGLLGDAAVDAVLAPLRQQLAALQATQALAAPDQTLRQVTVLFLDVVGSTTLSQHLDPEEIHAVMDGALGRCTAIVVSHQGKVLQYAGDSLLAVFGADAAREDDAERAVRAGLALLDEGKHQRRAVAERHAHEGFDVRVGIHTGGVLLGGGVDEEGTIRGMSVNVAARMEQSAPAGSLRISHDTWRLVRGMFDVEPQPPMLVKGRDEPILTYLVLRARPREFRVATRGIEGIATRMVGREAELEQLQHAFDGVIAGGRFGGVTVVADAGVGKSRLLFEFERWMASREEAFTVFRGRANPQTQARPYGLLRDILARWLDIADGDSMEAARNKIEAGIVPLFTADDGEEMALAHAHVLGHLIGLDFADSRHLKAILGDGRQIRSRGFHAAAQLFRRVYRREGVAIVLLLDDLHWADDPSLDFFSQLADTNADLPMLMLGLTRPTLFERRADLFVAGRIALAPLGDGSSRELADALLRMLAEIPTALRDLVTGRAEGNPFYMEELVMMLVDAGAIDASAEPWTIDAGKLQTTSVPHTLTGVLQARLDSLRAAEKLALQQASVIGFVFWDQALAAIDARAPASLPAVARRDLVVAHEEGDIDGAREYAFRHHLLHQVTYDTVLKRVRRDCHARAAAWLTSLAGARANDFLGVTAAHFEEAGDTPNACEYYARAAEHAATRFAHDTLIAHVQKAFTLAGGGDDRHALLMRWRLLAVRERSLDLQGNRAEQAVDIEALTQLAEALSDDALRAEVAWRRCDIAVRMGDFRTCESAARQAIALADRAGAIELGLRALQRLVLARTFQGDHAGARDLALQGLAGAQAHGAREIESRFTNALALIATNEGDLLAQLHFAEQGLSISREIGDLRTQSIELSNLGTTLLGFGAHAKAGKLLEEGLKLTRACGIRASETAVLANLSELALRLGEPTLALAHARDALAIATAVQDPIAEAFAALTLGDAALTLNRHADAAQAFARSRDVAHAVGDRMELHALAGLARAALARGDSDEATATVDIVLKHFATEDGANSAQEMLIWLTCWRVLRQAGDPSAAEVLSTAHAALQARAVTIGDASLRESFLSMVPENHGIVAAWAAQQTAATGD